MKKNALFCRSLKKRPNETTRVELCVTMRVLPWRRFGRRGEGGGRERDGAETGREAKGSSMWKSATLISSLPTSV